MTEPTIDLVRNGQVFTAAASTNSTNGHVNILLNNPADSGVKMYIYRLVVLINKVDGYLGSVFYDPTTALPTTVATVGNAFYKHPRTSKVNVMTDLAATTPLSGGFGPQHVLLSTGARNVVDLAPVVIPSGTSVGFTFTADTGKIASTSVHWWEE